MYLNVNGQPVDITLDNEKTVGDILASFEKEAAKNEATTTKIILDGKEIPPENFEEILNVPLKEDTKLDLSVISKLSITDSLVQTAQNISVINEELKDISIMLQSGKEGKSVMLIKALAEQIAEFCRLINLSRLFPSLYNKIIVDGKDLTSFFADFTPILKDFENALQENDTVTVGDLAEYEISPRLEQLYKSLKEFNN